MYFDYVATCPINEDILDTYNKIEKKYYMNTQSSIEAKTLEDQSKIKILEILNIQNTHEVIFTSGGTEANNLAILGLITDTKKHYITSSFEHSSVLEVFKHLKTQGHEVTYINPNNKGYIDKFDIYKEIKHNTHIISIMSINNEIGTIQNIDEIFSHIKKNHPRIITFSDTIQSIGKINLNYNNIDLFTISAHKIYGPKSIGALIKRKKIILSPILFGSNSSIRPGTQSLGLKVGLTKALNISITQQQKNNKLINDKINYFIKNSNKNISININPDSNILSISLKTQMLAESIITHLNSKNIFCSTRSACHFGSSSRSHVLQSINLPEDIIDKTIRISISHTTTTTEIDELLKELNYITKGIS